MVRVAATSRVISTKKNSILYNGDFEVTPPSFTAQTSTVTRWIDGTSGGSAANMGFGWATISVGSSSAVGFDTSVFRSGTASLKLSSLDATGTLAVGSYRVAAVNRYFPVLPNTSYKLTGYARTNNAAASSIYMDFRTFNAAGTTLVTTSTNKLSGTDATFREMTATVTTGASAVFGAVFLRVNVAGNISDAWFDDITLVPATTGRVAASGRVSSL